MRKTGYNSNLTIFNFNTFENIKKWSRSSDILDNILRLQKFNVRSSTLLYSPVFPLIPVLLKCFISNLIKKKN